MNTLGRQTASFGDELTNVALGALIGAMLLAGALRLAGSIAALVTGAPQPAAGLEAGVGVVFHADDPGSALGSASLSPVAYWITVALLVDLGTWGWEQANKALRGNDILEVRYAGWLGRFSAFVLRGVVRGRTWPATAAVYIGWPGAAALIGIGILWRWLFVIPAALIAHHALAARQARIMNERRRLP